MRFKPDIDAVRWRLDAFWNLEAADRALISVVAPRTPGAHISQFHNPRDLRQDPEALRRYWEDPETIRQTNLERLHNTFLGGEALPAVFQNYGTSGHCNYFGAQPRYGNDTIWFDPVLDDLARVEDACTEAPLERHLAIATYLSRHARDDYFVAMPDSTGTLDALGHLYGTQKVLLAMLEQPETVRRAIRAVNRVWASSNERFYQVSRELNHGGCHAWMHLLCPGRIQHLQCDMSVMFSPAMYEAFVLDSLRDQMAWCEYPVYHFDGAEQARHLPLLLGFGKLKAIQWTAVAGQPSAAHFLPLLQRMQQAGKRLIVMAPPGDLVPLLDNLSSRGLYLHTEAGSPGEALDLIRLTEKHSKG